MNFQIPTLDDIERIKEAFKYNEKKCCEMSTANTVLWSKYYKTEIAFWEGNIIFRSCRGEKGCSYSCNLLNAKNPKELFDKIVEIAAKNCKGIENSDDNALNNCLKPDRRFQMHCMLEEEMAMIEEWYPGEFEISYNRDESDYIYDREKLATLAGKKLHGKRNHINRFTENYPNWTYETMSDDNMEECVAMAKQWCKENCVDEENEPDEEKQGETKLVVKAIRNRKELGMIGGLLRADGRIVAITLGEPLTSDTFVVHFEKAFPEIQGAYPMINREFVKHELSEYNYVNREEDMGLEGLRKAKLSYKPEILLNKGTVKRKSISE